MGPVIIVVNLGTEKMSAGRNMGAQAAVGLPQCCRLLLHPFSRSQRLTPVLPQPRQIISHNHQPRKTERGNGKRAIAISQMFEVEGGIVNWDLAWKCRG